MSTGNRAGSSRASSRSFLRSYAEFAGAATMRRRSELRLNAARVEAELANRAKSEFIANMSHDLRTPLNAIIGFSELLAFTDLAETNSDKAREYARDISGAGRHLLGIINDILDLARLESGEPVVEMETSNVPEIVTSALKYVGAQASAKGQRLALSQGAGIPAVMLDPLRTKQIVINLLSNAVKFTPASGIISAGSVLNDEGGVTIAVTDNGPGMSATELEKALRRFGRVRNATTKGQEGTGLGLTIVQLLASVQGARFEISSQPGSGTSAYVIFPPTSIVRAV